MLTPLAPQSLALFRWPNNPFPPAHTNSRLTTANSPREQIHGLVEQVIEFQEIRIQTFVAKQEAKTQMRSRVAAGGRAAWGIRVNGSERLGSFPCCWVRKSSLYLRSPSTLATASSVRSYFQRSVRDEASEEEQEPGQASENARRGPPQAVFEEANHPLRKDLAGEIHARPSMPIKLPLKASYLVYHSGDDEQSFKDCVQHICALCYRYNVSPPSTSIHDFDEGGEGVLTSPRGSGKVNHYTENFGPFMLTWERHTEFTTYTFVRDGKYDVERPFDDPVISWVPQTWCQQIPGKLLLALNCAFESSEPALAHGRIKRDAYASSPQLRAKLSPLFDNNRVVGGYVFNGTAEVFSDFQVHEDGFGRVLMRGLTFEQAGKLLQSILEIETYRMMALLGLPLAKQLTPLIRRVHQDLYSVTSTMNRIKTMEDKKDILMHLFDLSAEVDRMVSTSLYRLDATMAYYAIVNNRIRNLFENPTSTGPPPIGGFLERRMNPAIDTCAIVQRRIDRLRHALNGPAELLQATVNLEIEKQNQQMTASMDARSKVQLRLQQMVEGLSVVAISYYSIGIVGYGVAAASAAQLLEGLSPELVTGASVPLIVAGVWGMLRRARKKLGMMEEQTASAADGRVGTSVKDNPRKTADNSKQADDEPFRPEGGLI